MQVVHEVCCGLDVHKKSVTAWVLWPAGRRRQTTVGLLAGFFSLRQYHTMLCNGYQILRMNGYEVVIANPKNDLMSRGSVTSFAVKCPYITGYTSSEHMSADTDPVDGYFLIDTATGTVTDGLSETAWRQRLSELHWENIKMRPPW
jgi:hypothetical protein